MTALAAPPLAAPRVHPAQIARADMDHCREAIRTGSHSFHAASRLLPAQVRDPALVLYAFCRAADDAVDEGAAKVAAVLSLQVRLDAIYAGTPFDAPEDRAMARVVATSDLPRALPDALLEGFAWDARGDRYADLSGLRAYAARVASAVGVMMCVLMGARDPGVLARAADLGVAMQLTNVARDVGEDARAGRLYLPTDWFAQARRCPEAFLRDPLPDDAVRAMTARLLVEARRLYARSECGIAHLPLAARPGIWAARLIYDGIGAQVRRQGCDSVSRRASTGRAFKLSRLALAGGMAAVSSVLPRSAVTYARPLDETAFLVEAAARAPRARPRAEALMTIMSDLAARDAGRAAR
ncbi:MAG: phytoene/squalene synthase family protein [Paracoccaceae bacterium]